MQLLKSVVIGLGVLIFLGLGLLAYGFIQKANNPDWQLLSDGDKPAGKPFDDLFLDLKGCRITGVESGPKRAYLLIGGGDEDGNDCNRVIVIDTGRGRVLGAIKPGP